MADAEEQTVGVSIEGEEGKADVVNCTVVEENEETPVVEENEEKGKADIDNEGDTKHSKEADDKKAKLREYIDFSRKWVAPPAAVLSVIIGLWCLPLEPNFRYWVLPILVVQSLLVFIASFFGNYVRQVLLSIVGLWWCLAALWVEALMCIWYPKYDLSTPMVEKYYVPFCDYAPWAQCHKVVMYAPYARLLQWLGFASEGSFMDFATPTLGVFFYISHIFYQGFRYWEFPWHHSLWQIAAYTAVAYSTYAFILLIFVLQDFCVGSLVLMAVNVSLAVTFSRIVEKETQEEIEAMSKYHPYKYGKYS